MVMTIEARVAGYRAQRHGGELTPRQARRVAKCERIASSPLHGVRRASRLRKAHEAKHRREIRGIAAQAVGLVRALRTHRGAVLAAYRDKHNS